MLRLRIVPQSEVIRAIFLETVHVVGVPHLAVPDQEREHRGDNSRLAGAHDHLVAQRPARVRVLLELDHQVVLLLAQDHPCSTARKGSVLAKAGSAFATRNPPLPCGLTAEGRELEP